MYLLICCFLFAFFFDTLIRLFGGEPPGGAQSHPAGLPELLKHTRTLKSADQPTFSGTMCPRKRPMNQVQQTN